MSIKSDAIVIRDETVTGANTAARVGGNLVAIADELVNLFHNTATGLAQGGIITINADTTKFDVSAGFGYIVDGHTDVENPTVTKITWSAITGITPQFLASNNASYAAIASDGTVYQTAQPTNSTERRNYIRLGLVVHPNNTNIFIVNNKPNINIELGGQFQDVLEVLGFKSVTGNRILPAASTGMQLRKEAGTAFKGGANFNTLNTKPHFLDLPLQSTVSFKYRLQNGNEGSAITTIDPTKYDLDGVLTAIPATATLASVQQVYIFQEGDVRIQYGQKYYNNLSEALTGINSAVFVTEENIANNGLYLGSIAMIYGTTNLNNILQAVFVPSQGTTINGSIPYASDTELLSEDLGVTGTQDVDWSFDIFRYVLTASCTFSDVNLPQVGGKKITIYLSGNFTPTFPSGWNSNTKGSYVSTVLNKIEIQYVKATTPFWVVRITQSD